MFVIDTIAHRLKRGCETMAYPDGPPPALPDRHGGALKVDAAKCADGCNACVPVCPTQAIARPAGKPVALDLGRCIFCAACVEVCPPKRHHANRRSSHGRAPSRRPCAGRTGQEQVRLAAALDEKLRKLFGRSLRLRQVSAGGCGACEADTNVLGTIGWDLSRFGIQFVASPRHADGLLITGCISRNMELALKKTWDAVPEPKIVIAVGACAIAGGPFVGHPRDSAMARPQSCRLIFTFPVARRIRLTILDGLLRLLDRLEEKSKGPENSNPLILIILGSHVTRQSVPML